MRQQLILRDQLNNLLSNDKARGTEAWRIAMERVTKELEQYADNPRSRFDGKASGYLSMQDGRKPAPIN